MQFPVPARLAWAMLRLVATVAAAFVLATAVRHGLIERDDLGAACAAAGVPWECPVRMFFIQGFVHGLYGYVSVALAALAAVLHMAGLRAAVLASPALVVGTFGMVLYDFTWSAAGVVLAALLLARTGGQWQQDSEAEQHAS